MKCPECGCHLQPGDIDTGICPSCDTDIFPARDVRAVTLDDLQLK